MSRISTNMIDYDLIKNDLGSRQGAVLRYEDGSLAVSIEPCMTDEEMKEIIEGMQSGNKQKRENEFEELLNEYLK